jgi:translation initiation factor 3 subunit G
MRDKLKDKKVRCRICDGEHFTARCPFKDTMAPMGEDGVGGGGGGMDDEPASKEGGLGGGGSSYVPPHLRKGAGASAGERMGGKYERDDLATLRVTNVSEFAEEQDLREIFERFGRVTRVFLAKDRETGRAKGFAFISFQERSDAAKACEKVDGCEYFPWVEDSFEVLVLTGIIVGYRHLILRVEFAKRAS